MSMFLRSARLALPTLFFGYAIFANLTLVVERPAVASLPDSGLLSGGLTRDLDSLYKHDLPHISLSFGLIGAARYVLLGEARAGVVVGQDGWLFSTEEVRPLPAAADLSSVVGTVQNVQAQLSRMGADLVVVPLPAKIDIYRRASPDVAFGDHLAQLYAGFVAGLVAGGVTVVDARRALLDPAVPVFFASDTHWTPAGAQQVALAIAGSGTIIPGALVFDWVEGPAKTLTGDLVGFVTTPPFGPAIGLPRETVTPVVLTDPSSETDIFGTAGSDIVLVGTSYSANPDWGFATALMQVLGRDVVNVAQEGLGPLEPMQDYLASDDLRTAPPAVVIWEIPIRYLTDPAIWRPHGPAFPKVAAWPSQENADG